MARGAGVSALRERGPVGCEVRDVSGTAPQVRRKARQFVRRMTKEDRMLVVLKRELYEGDWDEMVADLQARLEGRPYIFKLANRITEDLERIAWLRDFEQSCGVDLGDYVGLDG